MSSHDFSLSVNTGGWIQNKKKQVQHTSNLILCITNYWFVKNSQAINRKLECKLKDLHVTIKLASTTFETENSVPAILEETGERLFFDKAGICLPFPAFMGLLHDPEFVNYVRAINDRYLAGNFYLIKK